MKMAKPTPADLDHAAEFVGIRGWVEDIERGFWPAAWPESDSDEGPRRFNTDDADHLKLFYERVSDLALAERPGGLNRVVLGMHTVMDPRNGVVNQDSDVLELHPSRLAQ